MAERLATLFKVDNKPLLTEMPYPQNIYPTPEEMKGLSVPDWNLGNTVYFARYQMRRERGCALLSAYMARGAFFGEEPLPTPTKFVKSVRDMHPSVLREGKFMTLHSKFNENIEIFEDFGVGVNLLTCNMGVRWLLGDEGMKNLIIPVREIRTMDSLDLSDFPKPHICWVGKDLCSDSHFVTDDGSNVAKVLIKRFQEANYKPIGILELSRKD